MDFFKRNKKTGGEPAEAATQKADDEGLSAHDGEKPLKRRLVIDFFKQNKEADHLKTAPREAEEALPPQSGEELVKYRRNSIIHIIYWILMLVIIYMVAKYLIGYLAPFVIGFAIALILRPAIVWLRKKLKIKHNIVAIAVVALFYSTVGVLAVLGLISIINSLIAWLPEIGKLYTNTIGPELDKWVKSFNDGVDLLDPELTKVVKDIVSGIVNSLGNTVTTMTNEAVNWLRGALAGLPGFFLNTVFTIIFTFFISVDYGKATQFIMRQLPERQAGLVRDVKHTLGSVIWQFVCSYSMIMFITFVELSIGLLILGVGNPFLIAVLIAIFDILPIVGTGTVVIPWALISLLTGSTGLGIGLLVMYAVIFVVRNVIEPRIVGKGTGVHPLATLLGMLIGTRLFGVVGLFGVPMALAILKSLNDRKVIRLFK